MNYFHYFGFDSQISCSSTIRNTVRRFKTIFFNIVTYKNVTDLEILICDLVAVNTVMSLE